MQSSEMKKAFEYEGQSNLPDALSKNNNHVQSLSLSLIFIPLFLSLSPFPSSPLSLSLSLYICIFYISVFRNSIWGWV